MRGVTLTADDLLRRDVIQKLMCEFRLDFDAIGRKHGIRFAETFAAELGSLDAMVEDGLVVLSNGALEVTPRGRMLVRNIAMVFDRYLREARERAGYSRVI